MYHVNLENKKKYLNRPKGSFVLLVLKITGMVMVLIFTSKHSVRAQVPDTSYFQTIKTDIPLPPEAGKNVLRLFQNDGVITIVTDSGTFRYAKGSWQRLSLVADSCSRWVAATADSEKNIWLATVTGIKKADGGQIITLPEAVGTDTILCLYWEDEKTLHVGTNKNFLTWNGRWVIHSEIKWRVNAVIADAQKNLWVATSNGLWRHSDGKWINLDETLMAVGNERTYFSLAMQNDGKDLLFSSPRSVGCIAGDGNHWVVRGADGLPYGPVKVIRPAEDGLWLGTARGAVKKDSTWHYFNGRRWLPDNRVNDILPLDAKTVWIATPNGISEIKQIEMTLHQKADLFEKIIEMRHNRRGLINHSKLKTPGDVSTSYTENEDNDGLWTACYLAAECFCYGTTGSSDAKTKAVRTFEALERLETITGIPGYPARSYALATDSVKQSRSPHPKKWHLSPDGKWLWLDDTSSDEIVGHIFTIALFHDLVADHHQKERAKKLIERILNHIVDNNFHLIDFDGKPTRWGIWNPDSLNHSKNWMYEKGLNSLQILSHLKTGAHLTGISKFEKVYAELIEKHGYANNAVEAKMYGPFETSHSDDILNFFPYYYLLRYAGDDANLPLYRESLERSWRVVKPDRMPVWNIMASVLLNKDCDMQTAVEELRQYPLDLINWSMENSHRWDLQHDQLVDRGGREQATKPVPSPESGVSRWNTNPKQLDVGNGGRTEESGTFFLFAYWMARYYGWIAENGETSPGS